jgi:hypothetical protein
MWRAGRGAALALAVGAVAAVASVAGCGGSDPGSADERSAPAMAAQMVQLRRDQVLQRVEVAIHNRSGGSFTVDRLRVAMPGFRPMPAIDKDSPIAAGLTVNLPWTYGDVRCRPDRAPDVGRAVVHLRVHTDSAPEPVDVTLPGRDPDGLLQRIANRACLVERVDREVSLRFDDSWSLGREDGRKVLHGTLIAHLKADEPRDVSEVAGAIMYGLLPDESAGAPPEPLASLTPDAPDARVPVIAYAARCDGHVKGEIKKPFEFLVWVGPPGDDEPVAVTPEVGDATKLALRQVCAF